eukprot:5805041-Pyramimonas_sp.AAC.1
MPRSGGEVTVSRAPYAATTCQSCPSWSGPRSTSPPVCPSITSAAFSTASIERGPACSSSNSSRPRSTHR